MAISRRVYFKAGEVLTLLAVGVFAFYIVRAYWSADDLLSYEDRARRTTVELYRQEAGLRESDGAFAGLSDLIVRCETLSGLKIIPPAKLGLQGQQRGCEVATDGRYFYMLRMTYPELGVSDLNRERDDLVPEGFKAVSWPTHFGISGEVCYYVDETGKMGVTANTYGTFDGLKALANLPAAIPDPALFDVKGDGKNERWDTLTDLSQDR